MPGKRRQNAVQKTLVKKQMTQVVEVHSLTWDRWSTTACPSSGGRLRRSELMLSYSSTSRQQAGAFGLSAGVAMDLRLGWDLSLRADQVKAEKKVERRETTFAHFDLHAVWQECKSSKVDAFSFEYPLAASEVPCLWKLRSIDGMRCVRCDQCQFGVTSVDSEGNLGPACKATGFMTNDEYIAEAVNRHCFWWIRSHPVVERQSEIL